MEFLLNKESQHKIDILTALELSPLQTTSIKRLSEKLSLSTFIIKKSLTQIIEEIDSYTIHGLNITLSSKEVSLHSNGTNTLSILKWIYIKQSHSFLLLDELFKESSFSMETFSQKFFLSLPTSYLLKSELESELRPYNISINSDFQLSGDEVKIRLLLFNIYYTYFNSFETPFSKELITLSTQFMEYFSDSYSPTQQLKVRFFLLITLQRLYQGKNLSSNEEVLPFDSIPFKIKKYMVHFFNHSTSLDPSEVKREVSFLLCFLYSENLIPKISKETALQFIQLNSPDTLRLTEEFLANLRKEFKISPTTTYYSFLEKELNRIHFKFIHYNTDNMSNLFSLNLLFLKENYPDFFIFIDLFIHEHLYHKETNVLYYDYIFTLIKYIPISLLNHPIYVCVDFSSGKSYNHFISTTIKSFKFLNIIIEHRVSRNTDLYLSDFKPSKLTIDYILWKNPPLPSDWEHFGNKIIELKNDKRRLD